MQCKSLWIKASAKCINVNVNIKCIQLIKSDSRLFYSQKKLLFKNKYWKNTK